MNENVMDKKNENGKNWLKVYVIEVLPLIVFFTYLLGVIYMEAYYSTLNIPIFDYVGFQTALNLVIEPLLLIAVIFLLDMMADEFIKNKTDEILYNRDEKKPTQAGKIIEKANKWIEKHFRIQDGVKNIISFLIAIPVLIFLYCYFTSSSSPLDLDTRDYMGIMILGGLAIASLSIAIHDLRYPNKPKLKEINPYIQILLFYILLVVCIGLYGHKKAEVCLEQTNPFEIELMNGRIYNQDAYTHVSHIDDKDFLIRREDSRIIILNEENIQSTSICSGSFWSKLNQIVTEQK